MTEERRQDALLVAVVLSLVAHGALMYSLRPQVMTHVARAEQRVSTRGPMRAQKAPATPENVRLDVVKDAEPTQESPEAVADDMSPASSFVAPDVVAAVGTPDLPALAPPEMAPPEASIGHPRIFEKMTFEKGDGFVVKMPDAPTESAAEAFASGALAVSPSAGTGGSAVPAALPVEEVAPPAPEVEEGITAPVVENEVAEVEAEKVSEFVPAAEVLSEVDEKVVLAEREAVKDLLDVRNARELRDRVNVSADIAPKDGWTYFRVKVTPKTDALPVVPKDVVILLDASGSIGKERLTSCRKAARAFLRSATNSGDRFNLVAFRDKFSYAFRVWRECDKSSFDAAEEWLDGLAAHGRTDVFSTIRSVLTLPRDPKRPLVALVVTDGDANTGVSSTADIVSRFSALNDGLVSVYMYGVKSSANRELIDVLTRGNRGESSIYSGWQRLLSGSGIEELSNRFRDPLLTDLRIVFAGSTLAEAYPRMLKNLYRGNSVEIVGRVPQNTKEIAFSLKGLNGATSYESFFKVPVSADGDAGALADAWRREADIDRHLR